MRAAAGYDRSRWQSYIDTTRGTPPHIREQALANAIAFCGPDRVLFGTDSPWVDQSKALAAFRALRLPPEREELILGANARGLLGLAG